MLEDAAARGKNDAQAGLELRAKCWYVVASEAWHAYYVAYKAELLRQRATLAPKDELEGLLIELLLSRLTPDDQPKQIPDFSEEQIGEYVSLHPWLY